MFRRTGTGARGAARWVAAVLTFGCAAGAAMAHGGGTGGHLSVGYYYGHDGSFENPADPPTAPTLLVDTHPWELGDVVYSLVPVDSPFLKGWILEEPGFEPLAPEDQEFGGHGYYSFLAPNYPHGPVNVRLHVDHVDAGLQILDPSTLQSIPNPLSFGPTFPHTHFVYFVDEDVLPVYQQDFTATFRLSDANGSLADSEPFTVRLQIVPEPGSAMLLAAGLGLLVRRRRA